MTSDRAAAARAALVSLGDFPAAILARDPGALAFALDHPVRPPAAEVEARLARAVAGTSGAAADAALRLARRREILRILRADAVDGAPLPEVAAALSDLAEATLRTVLDRELAAAAARDGPPLHADGGPAALACLALGKLGGAELNYSSDVDLLFLRSGDGACRAPGGAPGRSLHEHFADVARAVARSLSRRTEDGHLYRVDLRLRPRGTAGALVPRVDGAVHYYRSLGRGWERQAMLKARPVAGDLALGSAFLRELEPWVHGRPLLSAEISEIRRLKRVVEEAGDAAPGNLKTGRGGIRDVEFTVQFLQLLLGADHPEVRTGNTLEGLERLRALRALEDDEAAGLAAAYAFLRTAEHRLQAADDAQTHTIPADDEGLRRLALRMGLGADGSDAAAEFRALHRRHADAARAALDRHVHGAFAAEEEKARRVVDLLLGGGEPAPAEVAAALAPFGFRDPKAALADLRRMAGEASPWLPRTRAYFASAAPALLTRSAATPDPDRSLSLLQRLAERSAGSGLFFRLLTENPDVLGVFCDLGGTSPVLADLLGSRPAIMDAFLDALVVAPRDGLPPFEDLPLRSIEEAADPRAALRDFRDLETLRVATRDLQGRANVRQTARALSDLAEAVVRLAAAASGARLRAKHGPAPGRFAVLALGRLGAREMAYGSDLDLLFVHDAGDADASDYHAHLGRAILAMLAGTKQDPAVYPVDMRLRPEGEKGPLAAPLPSLLRYLRDRARTWERQALVRARFAGGDESLGREALEGIAGVLWGAPPAPGLLAEVRGMRARLEAASDPADLKTGRGGAQDAEFLVQALVLLRGRERPEVRRENTVDALTALREAGALLPEEHEGIATAYLYLRTAEMRLRLSEEPPSSVLPSDPAALAGLARRLGYVDTNYATAAKSLSDEVAWYRASMRRGTDRVHARLG